MSDNARPPKADLTAHVVTSVGWLGGVAGFRVQSIVGLTSQGAMLVRGSCLSMNLIGQFIIVPLSLALTVGATALLRCISSHP
ncbi:MAG: hypothetical protein ABJE10_00200 [bacterium]